MSKGAATRERIVRKATALASRDGLGGVSIGVLADALQLSKSGLFAHFESKEDLQLSVLQQVVGEFTAEVLQPALQLPRGEDRLRDFFTRWLGWQRDDERFPGGCLIIAASTELDDQPGPLRDYLAESQRALLESLTRIARGAVEARQFRADLDPKQFAHELYALVVGYHQLRRLLRDRGEAARVQASFERLVRWAQR